jgi:dihydroorotate dehydrogenase
VYGAVRPLLFALPPHVAHALGSLALAPVEYVGAVRELVRPRRDRRLAVRALGLEFPSPIGLAGGFDKNGTRARALAALGFGFVEVGTVTARAQEPNPAPNLFRLPADRALVNRLGFPNEGARKVVERLLRAGGAAAVGVPLAVSIGKSRAVELGEDPEPVIADYMESLREAVRVADFVVVNVSSPNTRNLRAMQGPQLARALFRALRPACARAGRALPLLVKIAPDLDDAAIDAVCDVAKDEGLDGVVATNTTVRRDGLRTDPRIVEAIGAGGLSGPPLRGRALEVVRRVRARLGQGPCVIGVGGVETGADAHALLGAGADLVQLYTALVYRGPRTPVLVARELLAARGAR